MVRFCRHFFDKKRNNFFALEYQEHLYYVAMRKPIHQEAKNIATKNKEAEAAKAEAKEALSEFKKKMSKISR